LAACTQDEAFQKLLFENPKRDELNTLCRDAGNTLKHFKNIDCQHLPPDFISNKATLDGLRDRAKIQIMLDWSLEQVIFEPKTVAADINAHADRIRSKIEAKHVQLPCYMNKLLAEMASAA
jgi:hypothetical protein